MNTQSRTPSIRTLAAMALVTVAIASLLLLDTAWAQVQIEVEFEHHNHSVAEPANPGDTVQFEVAVVLNQASGDTVTVNYATSSDAAKPVEDYLETSGTLTFPPNTTKRTLFVNILGDDLTEDTQRFKCCCPAITSPQLKSEYVTRVSRRRLVMRPVLPPWHIPWR